MRLKDKVAIVTGGAQGIGRAAALAFAEEGGDVVVVDKDGSSAAQVAEEVRATGRRTLSVRVDVTDEGQVCAMAQRALDELGSIDILVNCAGIFTYGSVADLSVRDWDLTLNVNLRGTLLCCRAVLPRMISKKSGVIINFSSSAVEGHGACQSAYVASKLGVESLTRAMAAELKASSIRVNAIRPGAVDTEIGRNAFFLKFGRQPEAGELAHWTKPRDIARVAVFLASEDSRIISGKTIDCYGFEVYRMNTLGSPRDGLGKPT